MSEPAGLKIVVVGPKGCGKSSIVDFLTEQRDSIGYRLEGGGDGLHYEPTIGVRVLETETSGSRGSTPVEVWDVSGDQRFDKCWPAVIHQSHGVVLVYNPDEPAQTKEVELWYEFFVKNAKIEDRNCLLLAHRTTSTLPLSGVKLQATNFESKSVLRSEFDKYISTLASNVSKK